MAGTFTQILFHVVFSTKRREPLITDAIRERLYAYVGGIVRAEGGVLYAIGGIEDHVHMYLRWRPDRTIADLVRTVKSRSSRWVHEEFEGVREFAWQQGYAAFSVSPSQENAVKTYIASQREHHAREDYRSELTRILAAHGVTFDERYVVE